MGRTLAPNPESAAEADESGGEVDLPQWAEQLGLTVNQVANEIDRLAYAEYVMAETHRAWGTDAVRVVNTRVMERGLRELELWPSDDPYAALMAVIDARIAELPDDAEEKTKLAKLRGQRRLVTGRGRTTAILMTRPGAIGCTSSRGAAPAGTAPTRRA